MSDTLNLSYLRARADSLGEDYWFGPVTNAAQAEQACQKIEGGFAPGLVSVSIESDLPAAVTEVRPTDDAFFADDNFLHALIGTTAQMIARQRSGDPLAFHNDQAGAKANVYGATHTPVSSGSAPAGSPARQDQSGEQVGQVEQVDWRAMFFKYAEHVRECDGEEDFLSTSWDPEQTFTPTEWSAIKQASTRR